MIKAFVKRCRAVAAGRGDAGVVLLDGDHLLADALAAGVPIDAVLTDGRHPDLIRRIARHGTTIVAATSTELSQASPVRTSSGLVALARWQPAPLDDLLAQAAPLLVGLVGVQDPGNVGGIIRSAEALDATGVLALDDTADPGGWKALRGAMGSTFRLPVGRGHTRDLFAAAARAGVVVAAAVPSGGTLDAGVLARPLVVLVGAEGSGLPDAVVRACGRRLTIPMQPRANSLNVGVSAALILWEARMTTLRGR